MSIARSAQPLSPAVWRYGMPAIVLHWVLAVLIAFLVVLGWSMMTVERQPEGPFYFDLHRSFGLLAAVLVALRVGWRFTHGPAALPAKLPRWQVQASSATHWLLYVCMVVLPITGFVGSQYSKAGIRFFGLPLPTWTEPVRSVSHLMFTVHSATVWVLVALVIVHAAAGFKHLLVDRDAVFQRMWF
jgi:cytochrome b561